VKGFGRSGFGRGIRSREEVGGLGRRGRGRWGKGRAEGEEESVGMIMCSWCIGGV